MTIQDHDLIRIWHDGTRDSSLVYICPTRGALASYWSICDSRVALSYRVGLCIFMSRDLSAQWPHVTIEQHYMTINDIVGLYNDASYRHNRTWIHSNKDGLWDDVIYLYQNMTGLSKNKSSYCAYKKKWLDYQRAWWRIDNTSFTYTHICITIH